MARKQSSELLDEFENIFDYINDTCEGAIATATATAAKTAVKELKRVRFKNGNQYSKGWAYKKNKNGGYTVHNKKYYMLTHLLENGHDIVRNGVKVGYSKPVKHIKPVEEKIQNAMEEFVLEELDKRGL